MSGQFRSLAEPWADRSTSAGRLMIVVLGVVGDVGCELIFRRAAEGRRRSKVREQHMGYPPTLTSQQQAEARQCCAECATLVELARCCNAGVATISRLAV